jgi:hypothetical protein
MIYELCQSTQEFLSARNKKPIESEHAEMLKMNEEKAVEEEVNLF